jgi:hypothetical protein
MGIIVIFHEAKTTPIQPESCLGTDESLVLSGVP